MKKNLRLPPAWKRSVRSVSKGLLTLVMLLLLSPGFVYGQDRISIKIQKGTLADAFTAIQNSTDYRFLYSTEDVKGIQVSEKEFKQVELRELLQSLLNGTGLTWQINENLISVKKSRTQQQPKGNQVTVNGHVTDEYKKPLSGVTVMVKGSQSGTITDLQGNYTLNFTKTGNPTLIYQFLGMKTLEMAYREGQNMNVVMESAAINTGDIVVTGIYTRSKESFTGSSSTFTKADLKAVGNQNILQSLKTLDPAFAIIENNDFGSDPNTMPDIEIRGKTSIMGLTDEYGTNPNQPLFIVDGFESTLSYVMDMSMDMVESITVLKDAASTAIYGSKAANGVIVIETRKPEMGKLKLNYNGNFNITTPDLTDYNLMNAAEKLEYERLSGRWGLLNSDGSIQSPENEKYYMKSLSDVLSGVDTYWLHLPLRVGFTHKHTLFVEGGANEIRYGVGLSYGNTQGVMVGSGRETLNGNIRLTYRTGNVSFNNILNIDNLTSSRENVEFSRFAPMNPYLRKTDENGDVIKRYNMMGVSSYPMNSPLWDMGLGSFNKTGQLGFSNNFEIEWRILNELRVRGRFSVGKKEGNTTEFMSPFHTSFIGVASENAGSYLRSEEESQYYNGDASVTYGKLFNDVHRLNAVLGFDFRENKSLGASYTATGFVDDDYPNPNSAEGYKPSTSPLYSESRSRSASYYLNVGYSYDDRYLLDANFRMDGSSIFGVDHHFTDTWSVGIGWNIHKEAFMEGTGVDMLKIRASVGNPGNQNFNDYISERVYSYTTGNPNKFGTAMIVSIFGNSDLKWQKTLDNNIGFDFAGFNNRLKVSFDYYYKETNPLLVYIGVPTSTGVNTIPYNLGAQRTKGMNLSANYNIIVKNDVMWSVNATVRSVKSTYHGLGNSLEKYNDNNRGSNSLYRFYDGGSSNDLWAVRSLGIEPGTGREMFMKKDGTETFDYDRNDEVIVGNTEPDAEGIIGSRVSYKGFSFSFNIRYRLGGQALMSALYDKVENVERLGGGMGKWYNQDKRALYDRWQNPGDDSKFISIKASANPITSRFVMDNNVISGESISLSYETQAPWVRYIGASSMNFGAYMNDIFRISTIKNERGIEYPFARSVSFSIGLRF